MSKQIWRAVRWISNGKTEGSRRGRRRRNTQWNQRNRLVLPSTPAVNACQRWRARPCDASVAMPLASVWHAGSWGGVPTAPHRLDGKGRYSRRTRRRKQERGRWSAIGGKEMWKRMRHNARRERKQGQRWRVKGRTSRPEAGRRRRHQRTARGQQETCQDINPPRRTYVSGRSTETGFIPILACIWTEASATIRSGRRGGIL